MEIIFRRDPPTYGATCDECGSIMSFQRHEADINYEVRDVGPEHKFVSIGATITCPVCSMLISVTLPPRNTNHHKEPAT